MLDHTLKSDVTARRLEVITETGRRRWFSKDDKARIVEETFLNRRGVPTPIGMISP
jgi:transposase